MPVKLSNKPRLRGVHARLASEAGFTLMVALGVLLVTSLLLGAAFEAARGDIQLSHRNTIQKEAYYAALAGIQEYEYHLQANPDYWETCAAPSNTVPKQEELTEHYEIKLLVASTAPEGTKECSTTSPFASMIQSSGVEANTFRLESIGTAGNKAVSSSYATRTIIATFHVIGFLNFIYFTQYEDGDPALYGGPKECENYYPKRVSLGINGKCATIEFANGDTVEGPMHTDDAADICAPAYFGRKGHNPLDTVQINNGVYSTCGNPNGTFYTATGKYEKGEELLTPEGDTTLGTYVKEGGDEFTGSTHIVLKGTTMEVTNAKGETKPYEWPTNGLVYVRASENKATPCTYAFNDSTSETDNATEVSKETYCGNVYVSGTYSKPITIAAEEDLIINGNISPTSVKTMGEEPTGTNTLGLIAGHYVRVYHPVTNTNCEKAENGKGSLENPWIYASDPLNQPLVRRGQLRMRQAARQPQRLRSDRPALPRDRGSRRRKRLHQELQIRRATRGGRAPYFLNPINAGWKVARETAPNPG